MIMTMHILECCDGPRDLHRLDNEQHSDPYELQAGPYCEQNGKEIAHDYVADDFFYDVTFCSRVMGEIFRILKGQNQFTRISERTTKVLTDYDQSDEEDDAHFHR